MNAGEVAGLLVLLGVVGVLASIVGSGIEAGPVKFPSIPRSRQKPLALASAVVIVGGVLWWVIQQQAGSKTPPPSQVAQTAPATEGKLTVRLIPANSNIHVGDRLVVHSEVYDSFGQLGTGQCLLKWSDALSGWKDTTPCNATVSEPPASEAGVYRIIAKADGLSGLVATGTGSVDVTVRR